MKLQRERGIRDKRGCVTTPKPGLERAPEVKGSQKEPITPLEANLWLSGLSP